MAHVSMKNLKPGSHIHLMGICGTAMASLAGLLKDRGYKVTGSDLNPYPPMSTQIEALGIKIERPYKAENLDPSPDFVVVGNVISANNAEALELVRKDLPYCSLPEAMGEIIIADKQSYVISGTHGKTTTTSLMSWVADCCGLKPGFLIGGIPKNFSQSFRNPAGDVFVIEGDEYDTAYFDKVPKFIHYRPKNVILTSVEFDHADIYKDFAAVKSAFLRLMKLIPATGSLVYWGDNEDVNEIAQTCEVKRKFSYGTGDKCDYRCIIFDVRNGMTLFEVLFKNDSIGKFETPMVGEYNILNATAVIAQAHINGFSIEQVKKALRSFEGVKRRQEILGVFDGVTVIEDFAHHPTAVKETVKAIQKKYVDRKVFSVFEPRSATSRRKVFQKDYVSAFEYANEIIIAEAFDQAKISEDERFSTSELVADLKKSGKQACQLPSADKIVNYLAENSRPNDIILIMSNGGFDGIYEKLISALKSREANK